MKVSYAELLEERDQLEAACKALARLEQRQEEALDAIYHLMDGEEWDSDTTSAIGEILVAAGYTIHDPNGLEEFDHKPGKGGGE